jgi:2-aminoadipate transaminase
VAFWAVRGRRYGPTRGDGRYVRELATFLTAQHGGSSGAVAPEHLCLTSGATAGCALISALFLRAGMNVFIEDPSYFLAVEMFRDFKLNMISVRSDAEGMDMQSLQAEITLAEQEAATAAGSMPKRAHGDGRYTHYAGLIFVVPTYGNPTGATMSNVRRQR